MEAEVDQLASNHFYFYSKYKQLTIPDSKTKSKSGRHYRCYRDSEESLIFQSFNFRTGTAGYVFFGDPGEPPNRVIKLRKSFPISGKMDVRDFNTHELLGVITRGRKFYDAGETRIGRFVDPRSWKELFGESAVDAIGQLIFGNVDAPGGGLSRFGLVIDEKPAGYLDRQRLPFFPDPPRRTEPHRAGAVFKKVLPQKLGSALFDITPPTGWKLAVKPEMMPKDLDLLLLGTLMVIELNNW